MRPPGGGSEASWLGRGTASPTSRTRWAWRSPWRFRPLMFGAGDCKRPHRPSFVRPKSESFRPLMFGAGDCKPRFAWVGKHVVGGRFQTPHVRGGGLQGWPSNVARTFTLPVSDPSCSGRGTASATAPAASRASPARFRPLMFGAGDCKNPVALIKQTLSVKVSDPSCSGRGTARTPVEVIKRDPYVA